MSQTTAIKPVIPINNHTNKLVRSCYVWVVMAANMLLGECFKIASSETLTRGLKKTRFQRNGLQTISHVVVTPLDVLTSERVHSTSGKTKLQ